MAKRLGRPPLYETPEEMQAAIDQYFVKCEGEVLRAGDGTPVLTKAGQPVVTGARPPTITGLALWLGFESTQSLKDYKGKKDFSGVITRAKSRVEQYAAERLFDRDGQKGAEFTLRCHFGWKLEKEEQDDQAGVIILGRIEDDRH